MTSTDLRFVDADGHVLEHPTEMLDYAPAQYRDRIWHIETAEDGDEFVVFDGRRSTANTFAQAGTAGMTLEDRERAQRGELKYTQVRPAAYNAKARLDDMDPDGIDVSVLYPTACSASRAIPTSTSPWPSARRTTTGSPTTAPTATAGSTASPSCRNRTSRRRRPRSAAARASRSWSARSSVRTRAPTGSPSTTRSTTRSGRPPATSAGPSASTRSSTPTSPGACLGMRINYARHVRHPDPGRTTRRQHRQHLLHPDHRQPVRHDERR